MGWGQVLNLHFLQIQDLPPENPTDKSVMPLNTRLAGFTLSALLFFPAGSPAQLFVATGRDTLRGLPGVEVLVENVSPDLQPPELAGPALRTAVETRLKAGGVTVYATQVANASDAKAYVYVHIDSVKLSGTLHAVAIQVHLRQTVRSTVGPSNIVNAMTWDNHTIAAATAAEGAQVRDLVLEMVGRFIADWRAVH
jgi:hypothetical protein